MSTYCQSNSVAFYTFLHDNFIMTFFDRVRTLAKSQNQTIESVLPKIDGEQLSRDIYNGWRRRSVLPRADTAVLMARNLGTTVEFLVDGEDGLEYVRGIVAEQGGAYRPPPRIAPIVDDLAALTDSQVDDFRTSVHAIAAARRVKGDAEGTG
jgi:hypothetical protein